jgi:hypothetical protein
MTEKKKLPVIEDWFEENKNENGCAGMTVRFRSFLPMKIETALNKEIQKTFDGKIFPEDKKGDGLMNVEVTLDLVLSKDKDGEIVYFIDNSIIESI